MSESTSRLHAHVGTLRQLEILLALHRHGGVTAAAEALYLTQPTVSIQLKKLSDAIGMPLYYQAGRRIMFTDAGLAAVRSAREVLGCFERLEMTLTAMRGLHRGRLKLGIVSTAKYFIPHLIGDFCHRYPEIEAEFNIDNREQILARLAQGEDDFCVFSHPPGNPDYELIEFLPNRLVAIAPIDHPLSQQAQISLAEFTQAPFLMREQGSGTRYAIEQHMRDLNQSLNVRMTIQSNEAIKHSVMSGMGVSILSEHTLTFGGHAGLALLDVSHLPIRTNWYLVRLKSKPLSPLAEALLGFITELDRQSLLAPLAELRDTDSQA